MYKVKNIEAIIICDNCGGWQKTRHEKPMKIFYLLGWSSRPKAKHLCKECTTKYPEGKKSTNIFKKPLSVQRIRQIRLKSEGKCIVCGELLCEVSPTFCQKHLEYRRKIQRESKRRQRLKSQLSL